MGTTCFIAVGVFSGRTICLPSFNGLHCKLAKIALVGLANTRDT